jgi:DNA-3-methyladenine glycosylase II
MSEALALTFGIKIPPATVNTSPALLSPETVQAGLIHLRSADAVLASVIEQAGPFGLKPRRHRFESLARSILSQQISTSAAESIKRRLFKLLAPGKLTAENLRRFTPAELRVAGISPQKASYLLDLAIKVSDRTVKLHHLHRLPDEAVVEELVRIKGIGEWTAHMFLMFCLGRADVFPYGDLGIRIALRDLYGLRDLPDEKRARRIAEPWRPYATIASWYCWRSIDLKKAQEKSKGK